MVYLNTPFHILSDTGLPSTINRVTSTRLAIITKQYPYSLLPSSMQGVTLVTMFVVWIGFDCEKIIVSGEANKSGIARARASMAYILS